MSDHSAKLTATLKAGQGFDSPWIVLYADTPQDLVNLLDAVHLTGLGTKVATVAKGFQAEYAVSELGTQHVATETTAPQAPAAVPSAPAQTVPNTALPHDGGGATAPAGKTCKHGPMTFRNGTSKKTGKPYSAYFCPSPQGTPDQCSPEFVR